MHFSYILYFQLNCYLQSLVWHIAVKLLTVQVVTLVTHLNIEQVH